MTEYGLRVLARSPYSALELEAEGESQLTKGKQVSEISTKEYGTIVFALEEYAQVLEKEGSYQTRNYVYELIWKLQGKAK